MFGESTLALKISETAANIFAISFTAEPGPYDLIQMDFRKIRRLRTADTHYKQTEKRWQ